MLPSIRRAVLVTSVLTCSFAFCQNNANIPEVGRIHGVVAGDATITLKLLPDVKTVASAHTNPNGAFEFRAVIPGRYLVAIEAPGFVLRRFGVILQAGKDIALPNVVMEREVACPFQSPPYSTSQPGQPITTTLCEILKDPDHFNGNLVQFRATVRHGFESSLLSDGTGAIWLDYAGLSVTMTAPGGVKAPSQPTVLTKDAEFEKMTRYLFARYRRPDGTLCDKCALYKDIIIDAIGVFEHVDTLTMGFGQQKSGVGFGHMSGYESRLVLQRVSNVTATPIDPSSYRIQPQ